MSYTDIPTGTCNFCREPIYYGPAANSKAKYRWRHVNTKVVRCNTKAIPSTSYPRSRLQYNSPLS